MISQLTKQDLIAESTPLAQVLHDCVHDGASIGFILPFTVDDATAFWSKQIAPEVETGARVVFVARENGDIAGTISVIVGTPANQPHRGEISKLMVHPDHRRKGIAKRLMTRAEAFARERGKTLLTLDTRTGDTAEPLYLQLGFTAAGVIPDYCLDVEGKRLDSTTYMFKQL